MLAVLPNFMEQTELAEVDSCLESNVDQDTDYRDGFLVVFISPSRQIPGEYVHYAATTVSFQILSNVYSSFFHWTLYGVATESVVK
jgi:hypothetical protein